MGNTERPHMSAVIEEMETHRTYSRRVMDVLEENHRGDQPECWQAAEDCANGFTTHDELLAKYEDE